MPPTMRLPKNVGTRKPKPMNAVRRIMEREQRVRDRTFKEAEAAAAAAAAVAASSTSIVNPSRQQCPNPACPKPNVVDGTCRTCGRVADDSNIVAEVTFGENSSGAAVVQGSYLAADQGGVRGVSGRDFRRVAGSGASEAREKGIREAKALMNQIKHHLNIPDSLVESGVRMYRIAATMNFTQGREKRECATIILYLACRQEPTCKVMLIDFADFLKVDVFRLGRVYKDFLAVLPNPPSMKHVVPEDLIWRFASKLEFYRDTNRVAEAAIRIIQRMRYDEMTHGRRPAGICGAALVMAARSLNYRRTVREVVYIAKVTMVTIQNRLDEFAMVPSANMTIDEFINQDFLEEHHDPPFFYKQKQEWKEKHTRPRKRKQPTQDGSGSPDDAEPDADAQNPEKRQKSSLEAPGSGSGSTDGPLPTPSASASPAPSQAVPTATPAAPIRNTDKDGFVIPPRPDRSAAPHVTPVVSTTPITGNLVVPEKVVASSDVVGSNNAATSGNAATPTNKTTLEVSEGDRVLRTAAANGDRELEDLAAEFGDRNDESSAAVEDRTSELAMAAKQGVDLTGSASRKGRSPTKGKKITMPIDSAWENDEDELEAEVERYLLDPDAIAAAKHVSEHPPRAKDKQAASQASTSTKKNENTPAAEDVQGEADQEEEVAEGEVTQEAAPAEPSILPPGVSISTDGVVSMAPEVHEDEFKDDPEVAYCLLSEDEIRLKEQIWSNQNKDYMRQRQQKYFKDKREAKQPAKPRRRTGKRAKNGDDQASPASSAAEAAGNIMKSRAVSSRLNYQAMYDDIFASSKRGGPGSTYGGASSIGSRSAVTSRAGSVADSEEGSGLRSPSPPARSAGSAALNKGRDAGGQANARATQEEEEDDGNNFDETGYEDEEEPQEDFDPFADDEPFEDY